MKNEEDNEVLKGKSLDEEGNLTLKMDVQTFKSETFGPLRTAYDNFGRPVFCLKDACDILGIQNPSDAKTRLKPEGVVRLVKSDGTKYNRFLYITEGNLYRLIFQSRKVEAQVFLDWVTETVLPSIRKYGRYDVQQIINSPECALAFIDSYHELKVRNAILEQINSESKEAREYVRRALDSGVLHDLQDVPAIINYKGLNKEKLFSLLRLNEVLNEVNEPNQLYIDKGWFRVDTHSYIDKKAGVTTHRRTFVYKTGINGIKRLVDKWVGKK